jgi:hypothetical protein
MFINELNTYILGLCIVVVMFSAIISLNNYNQYQEVQKAVSLELAEIKDGKLIWLSEDLKQLKMGPEKD